MTQSVVRKESFNSVTVFWLDEDLILERLRTAVGRLASDQNVLWVILIGSFAEGRAVPGSDIDIMIVLNSDERPLLERISEYLKYFSDIGIGVDLFPYTIDEMDNSLARQAAETGIILFSR